MGKLRESAGGALALALNEILREQNVDATVIDKGKRLHKWGYNASSAADTWETVQDGGGTETLLTANSITVADSTSASDTETLLIEGHYLDASGNLIFHVQTVTLTGTTAVTLSQPLARCSRMYVTTSDLVVGTVTVNAGEGGTAYNRIPAGGSTSEKAASSMSYRDYMILIGFGSSILDSGNNTSVSFRFQIKPVGGAWRTQARWSLKGDNTHYDRDLSYVPFIINPNTDFRIQASASHAATTIEAHMDAYLAIDRALINNPSPAPA
jgi:hypothetical protein